MYTAFKASGLSLTAAQKQFGMGNLRDRVASVEQAIKERESICLAIDDMCKCKEISLLQSYGLHVVDSNSDSGSDTDTEASHVDEGTSEEVTTDEPLPLPSITDLTKTFRESQCNWFEFIDRITCDKVVETPQLSVHLKTLLTPCLDEAELQLLEQSYGAYKYNQDFVQPQNEREVDALNGIIVPDAMEINAEDLLALSKVNSKEVQDIVMKRRKSIKRHAQYLKANKVFECNFLSKKTSTHPSIVNQCPDIDDTIEKFVEEHSIGADQWRRTGVLTFDGNTKVGKKVKFKVFSHIFKKSTNESFHMALWCNFALHAIIVEDQ